MGFTKDVEINNLETKVIYTNRMNFINDTTDHADYLDMDTDARVIKRIIQLKNVTPFALGLFGEWGSGKSFFMKRLRALMCEEDCKNILQIDFNAWHYTDTNVLVSLSNKIFRELNKVINHAPSEDEYLKKMQVKELKEKKELLLHEQKVVKEELKKAKELIESNRNTFISEAYIALKEKYGKGIFKEYFDILDPNEDYSEFFTEWKKLSKKIQVSIKLGNGRPLWFVIGCIAFIVAFSYLLIVETGSTQSFIYLLKTFRITSVVGLFFSGVNLFKKLNEFTSFVKVINNEQEAFISLKANEDKLKSKELNIQKQLNNLELEVSKVNSGQYLNYLLSNRIISRHYEEELGVINKLREDMELLSRYMTNDQNQSEIDRVVLYIDDLDRCNPKQVYDVLETLHLLLDFDLFVVIVAADIQWIGECLYKNLVTSEVEVPKERAMKEAYAYLEKIFHLVIKPFPLTDEKAKDYIYGLCSIKPNDKKPELINGVVFTDEKRIIEKVQNLSLTRAEIAYIQSTVSVIETTPRKVKRLINTYQLIKANYGILDKEQKIVLLLLAIAVFYPSRASILFELIENEHHGRLSLVFEKFKSIIDEEESNAMGFIDELAYEADDIFLLKDKIKLIWKYTFVVRRFI